MKTNIINLSLITLLLISNIFAQSQADPIKIKKTVSQLLQLRLALDAYYIDYGSYPRSLSSVIRYINVSAIPRDAWGNDFVYKCPGDNGREYDLISYGADGKKGGDGHNADIESWSLSKHINIK